MNVLSTTTKIIELIYFCKIYLKKLKILKNQTNCIKIDSLKKCLNLYLCKKHYSFIKINI